MNFLSKTCAAALLALPLLSPATLAAVEHGAKLKPGEVPVKESELAESEYCEIPYGFGTRNEPYTICKVQHLAWMAKYCDRLGGRYFLLTNDIDATETKMWNNGKGMNPIGIAREDEWERYTRRERETEEQVNGRQKAESADEKPAPLEPIKLRSVTGTPFYGHFNGNGFCISNLYINAEDADYAGLFGYVGKFHGFREESESFGKEERRKLRDDAYHTVISHLVIRNLHVRRARRAAALAGVITYADVRDCYVSGEVQADEELGGLAVIARDSFFTDCLCELTYDNSDANLGIAGCRLVKTCLSNVYFGGTCTLGRNRGYETLSGYGRDAFLLFADCCLIAVRMQDQIVPREADFKSDKAMAADRRPESARRLIYSQFPPEGSRLCLMGRCLFSAKCIPGAQGPGVAGDEIMRDWNTYSSWRFPHTWDKSTFHDYPVPKQVYFLVYNKKDVQKAGIMRNITIEKPKIDRAEDHPDPIDRYAGLRKHDDKLRKAHLVKPRYPW